MGASCGLSHAVADELSFARWLSMCFSDQMSASCCVRRVRPAELVDVIAAVPLARPWRCVFILACETAGLAGGPRRVRIQETLRYDQAASRDRLDGALVVFLAGCAIVGRGSLWIQSGTARAKV